MFFYSLFILYKLAEQQQINLSKTRVSINYRYAMTYILQKKQNCLA